MQKTYRLVATVAALGLGISLSFVSTAFAAYNDVTLTENTAVISVGGFSLNVTAPTALIETIVVNTSNFSVDVLPGSILSIVSSDKKSFDVTSTNVAVTGVKTCGASDSRLELSVGASATVTITPTGTCAETSGGGGSPVVASSGGGGGGGSTAPAPSTAVTTVTPVTTTVAATPATTVTAVATTETVAQPITVSAAASFVSDLKLGAESNEVSSLQTFLEGKGFLTMPQGVAKGYFGGLTKAALVKYQASVGLPSTGFFGPMTRAIVNGSPSSTAQVVVASNTAAVFAVIFERFLKVGSEGTDVTKLQEMLVAKGHLTMPQGVAYGYFGGLTKTALAAYQASVGIDPLGIVGPATRAKLNAELSAQ